MIICENRVGVTGTDRQCLALADGRHHRRFFKSPQPSARLYENTVSQTMSRMLGIVYRCIATQLIEQVGFSRKNARTGAVTLPAMASTCSGASRGSSGISLT